MIRSQIITQWEPQCPGKLEAQVSIASTKTNNNSTIHVIQMLTIYAIEILQNKDNKYTSLSGEFSINVGLAYSDLGIISGRNLISSFNFITHLIKIIKL